MLKITKVKRKSVAKELGLEVKDEVLAFDGFACEDELDYLYYVDKERFTMTVRDFRSGEEREVLVEKEAEEDAYMALYEPKQTGMADISRALDIEKQAWETADLLSVDEEDCEPISVYAELTAEDVIAPIPAEPIREIAVTETLLPMADDDEYGFIAEALSDEQRGALRAALNGVFASYCRDIGVMAENMRGEINEIAMEYIGDMILEGDFSVIEDYKSEIEAALHST